MAELGLYALRLAFFSALAGVLAGVLAGSRARADLARVAQRAVLLTFFFTAAAAFGLVWCLVTGDYTLAYVARHSAQSMALPYRIAALWGGQGGSLLLWVLISLVYASAATWIHRDSQRSLLPWVNAILLLNALFFLGLVNWIPDVNPFQKLPPGQVLSDGQGLNPLLQHPLMMIHPVLLYSGYTGFSVPFAFGAAALITGRLGDGWLRATRRWTLVPWFFLSAGILVGGRWAYEVLGWGGYWAWDPVENASFMPWLPATAFLHSVMIQEKRNMLKTWNLVLIGITYALCLFGTFLTRSGVISSVHSFTAAGWFGYVFLAYVAVISAAFLGLVLWRRGSLRTGNRLESLVSREASFVINNWVFMVILVIVLWGTMFPVLSEAVRGTKISVGPSFFNKLTGPFAALLLLLTGVGPLIAWRRASLESLRRQFLKPVLVGLAAFVATLAVFGREAGVYPLVLWSLGAFVIATITQEYAQAIAVRMRGGESAPRALATLLRRNQRRYGGYVVHLGVVFILIGISGAAFDEERLENVQPGGTIAMNGYRLEYLTAKPLPKQHYGGAVARLALYHGDEPLAVLAPQRRMYWLEQQPASIPSIRSTLREDLYVILTALEPDGSATLKIHRNPLVNFIWIGGWTFLLGALLVLWPHPERRATRGE
ncbi:MAG: heme lyase CcmF/NrfE family subunit [Deltaproteobacteria bacterium]|nr:heme lyase CcmF/NrfE family subunit [Deltaproteobacteria bacterium]